MNHDDAIREQAVERYLLGELAEDARVRFEEHFFDCTVCASELTTGTLFVDALRTDRQAAAPSRPDLRIVPKRTAPWPIRTSWYSLLCDGLLTSPRPRQ
jgi:anti-sigma factor RsiW